MYSGAHVGDQPNKAAVVVAETGRTSSYRDLDIGSLRFARDLYDEGPRPGDHSARRTAELSPHVDIKLAFGGNVNGYNSFEAELAHPQPLPSIAAIESVS